MKKTAKIFTILLTLCLLCGTVLSVVASATEQSTVTPYESLSVSGSDKNVNWDFNDGETVGNWTLGSAAVDSSKRQFGSVGDNKYFILSSNISTSNAYVALDVGTDISGAQYVTVDYDLATDKYVYVYDSDKNGTYDKASWEALDDYVAIPVYALNTSAQAQLSDRTSINTGTQYRVFDFYAALDNNGEAKFTTQRIGWEPDTGRHFLYSQSPSGYDTRTKVYLPNEINEFTHITKVYEIVSGDNGYNVTEYTYVNGVCYWSYSTSFTSIESLKTGKLNFKLRNSTSRFISLAIDNVAVNVYNTNIYDEGNTFETPIYNNSSVLYNEKYNFSANESFVIKDKDGNVKLSTDVAPAVIANIADYVATGDTIITAQSIFDFTPSEDVESFEIVFLDDELEFTLSAEESDSYKIQETPSGYQVTKRYIQIGENGTKLYNTKDIKAALASLKNNDTIYTTRSIIDFTPPEDVESFEIIFLDDGLEFTLSAEGEKSYIIKESLLGYKVTRLGNDASDKFTTVQWLDESGNVLLQETLPAGVVPSYSPITINTFDFENKTITKYDVGAWMWDIDGDGNELINREPMEIGALSSDEIDLIGQYCNGVVKIYPVDVTEKEIVEMAYVIKSGDRVLLDTAKTYLAYENSSTLSAEISAAPDGATVILYENAVIANTVSVAKNKNITIDLNGKSVTVDASVAFDISSSSAINLYSSVADARFIAPKLIDTENASGELVIGANCYFAENLSNYKTSVKLADNVIAAIAGTDVVGEVATVTLDSASYVEEDFALVVWKDALGNEFAKEYYHNSYTFVFHPTKSEMNDAVRFPKAEEGDNGWFDIGYTCWKSDTEGVELQSLVMGETNVFVPDVGPVAYLDLVVNASIRYTDVSLNICIPVPAIDSAVYFDDSTGVYSLGENNVREYVTLNEITIEGKQYYLINLPISIDSFDAPTVFVEYGAYGFGEEPIMFEKEISFSFMTYAESIAEVYACGSDDAKVVFDLVLYKYEAYLNAVGENADEKLVERVENFLDGHADNGCACTTDLEAVEFTESELLATLIGNEALADKILYAGFELDTARPYLYFYLAEGVDVKSFAVTHFGLEHQIGGWQYINHKITTDLLYAGTAEYNGEVCNVYRYDDLMLCNVAAIMNLKLEIVKTPQSQDVSELTEILTGEFSLAAYISSLAETEIETARLAKSLYVASKSAYEYRIIREDEIE